MAEVRRYRCRDCGHEFENMVFSRQEAEEMRRRNEPTFPVRCHNCNSPRIQEK